MDTKKTLKKLSWVGLFLFSFLIFLYMTFPFEVLKDTISAELSDLSGFNIYIGMLDSSLPLGLKAEKVDIELAEGGGRLEIDELKVKIGILPLFIGRLSVSTEIKDGHGGWLTVDIGLSLFKLISGGVAIPSSFSLESKQFIIDNWVDFFLAMQSKGDSFNPLLAPIISKISLKGKLEAQADFSLNSSNPTQSSGLANIRLDKCMLKLNDPALSLPDQIFNKAQIKTSLSEGKLVIDDKSGLQAQELEIGLNGKIFLKPDFGTSTAELAISVKLEKDLKNQFGFLLDAMAGGGGEGEVVMKIRGPLSNLKLATN